MDSSILIKNSNSNESIYLYPDEIVIDDNIAYGRIYLKVNSKKFFKKWSERIFFLTEKGISFWKMKKSKRVKYTSLYFDNFFTLGGIENVNKKNTNYYKFDITCKKNKRRNFSFKSYNTNNFYQVYKMINTYENNVINELYKD